MELSEVIDLCEILLNLGCTGINMVPRQQERGACISRKSTLDLGQKKFSVKSNSGKMVKAWVRKSTMSYQEAMGWNDDSGSSMEGRKKYLSYC